MKRLSVKNIWKMSLVAAVAMGATTLPSSALDPEDKPAIEKIVRDYLLSNPEIILEVQQALQTKQETEAKERAAIALTQNSDVIFNSKNQGVIGNKSGDVTVVEFFDYNCGFCQRAMNDMNVLLKEDNNLKFVMKELPILSAGSVEASRISTAVYRLYPDQYERFHNDLLGLDGPKDGARALEIAGLMGFDMDKLEAEAAKNDVLDAFREANDLATSLGMNGTPSYVIGDEVIFGALGVDVLRGKIENVRKCGKTVCT
jgi:protein-disulfide isomerase